MRYKLISQNTYAPSGAAEDVSLAGLVNDSIPESQAAPSVILTIRNAGPDPVLYLLSDSGTTAAHSIAASAEPYILSDVALPFGGQILRVPDGTTCYVDVEVSV